MLRELSVLPALILLAGCPHPAARKEQRQTAKELLPAALVPTGPAAEEHFTGRVRVYADGAYRAQHPAWRSELEALLGRANAVLEPTAGLHLELQAALEWQRHAPAADMQLMLKELEELDPGADVDWVIGLVEPLPDLSGSIDKLGLARPMGSHLILRGLNDAKEIEVLEAALGELGDAERQRLYRARKKHKETVLLLHELAHSLGAMHLGDESRLLYPRYDSRQESFEPHNARLLKLVVAERLDPDEGPKEAASALLAHLESDRWDGWDESERKQLLDLLRSRASGAEQTARAEELGPDVRPKDRKAYRTAVELDASGRTLEAWEKLEPLLDFYPDEAAVQILGCRLIMKRGVSLEIKRERCRRAAALSPDDPEPAIVIAGSFVNDKDRDAAFAALADARARLEQADGDHPRAWHLLAGYYKELQAVSLAEKAAKKAGDAGDILTWAAGLRARYALPPNAADVGIAPKDEAAYIADVKAMLKAIYAGKFNQALELVGRARRKYRGAPGVHVVLCDLAIRRRRYQRARRECQQALETFDGASWPHYLTGLLDKRDGADARAIAHLERAVELDGDLRHAYRILAGLYQQAGRTTDLARLRDTYHKRFGYPLK